MNCCDNNCRQGRDCPARKAYTGPAKPIPTHVEIVSDKAERVIFLLLAVAFAVIMYLE